MVIMTKVHLMRPTLLQMEAALARAANCEENASRATNATRRESLLRAAAAWSKIAEDIAAELGITDIANAVRSRAARQERNRRA